MCSMAALDYTAGSKYDLASKKGPYDQIMKKTFYYNMNLQPFKIYVEKNFFFLLNINFSEKTP